MDIEIKEVLMTFLQGRKYVFSLFHTVLGTEPTKEMMNAVSSEESLQTITLFESEDSDAAKELGRVLASCRELDDECLSRMRDEYTRLFIGPEDLIAAPWESVYTTKERALFQESTLAVRNWYKKYHYLPAGYPRIPDDHISLMMHFLELTTGKAITLLEEERLEECKNMLEGQKIFEKNHLLNWVGTYAEEMQRSAMKEFYPRFVHAAAEFLKYDHQIIDELQQYLAV